MKKNIDYLISALKSLIGFFDLHKSVIDPIVQIKEIAAELPAHYDILMENAQIQQESTTGVTKEKNIISDTLCHTLFPTMTLICNEAYKQEDIELSTRMKTTLSKLQALRDSILIATSKDVCTYCDEHTEELPAIGIQVASVEKLKLDTIELENTIGRPRELRSSKKTATENMDKEATKSNWLIQNRLTPLMDTFFAESDPTLLSDYHGIVHHDKIPSRKVCLIGIITDTDTGEPVEKVWIEIPGADVAYRVTSQNGRFQVKNMEEGTFIIRCSQANYHPKVVEFSHAWGITTHLNIEMEMTDIAKQQMSQIEDLHNA
jgi:hypothetical protein